MERIVNLSACMDVHRLTAQAADIRAVTDACSALHARCRRFMSAAASLLSDSTRIAADYTDAAKVLRTADRLAEREFIRRPGKTGREQKRFLSAVTPEGMIGFPETLTTLCPRIYSLEDEHGAASRLLLEALRERALAAGLDIISCACPLSPHDKLEHLLIPSIGVGFTTSNSWHQANFPVYRRIHAARFTDTDQLRQKKQILSFNRRAARELLAEAVAAAAEAKKVHDQIEQFYIRSMDWEAADALTHRVVAEFLLLAETQQTASPAD